MKRIFVMILFILPILASCATLNQNDCDTRDWYALGVSDGETGIKNLEEKHNAACSRFGIIVDQSQYLAGREIGLKQLCSIKSGFHHGVSSRKNFATFCKERRNNDYDLYYDIGTQIARLRADTLQVRDAIKTAHRAIDHVRDNLRHLRQNIPKKDKRDKNDEENLLALKRSEKRLESNIIELRGISREANIALSSKRQIIKNEIRRVGGF